MTIIGIIFNIFLLFIKGFISGFTLSSFILAYGYKGILLSSFYLIFGQLLNIIIVMTISIYSLMFTFKLLKVIFKNNRDNYFIILILAIFISIISSLCESFLLPALIKLIVKLYI